MNTFEKMLFLKSAPIFKYVKDDALIGVASILEKQLVQPGELIIPKGDLGVIMYMIVTGKVKIHDEDLIFKELGDHEIFGELSALSPAKRTASVTAVEETILLKISNTAIYDLMEIQPGLAKGIIHFLCQRIRSSQKDITSSIILNRA